MIHRPRRLPFSVAELKQVKLAPGETSEAAFNAWSVKVSAQHRNCERHSQTRLILLQDEGGFAPVYQEHREWGKDSVAKPGEFNFRAVFYCPACVVANALCPPEFHETSFATFDTSTTERKMALAKARVFAAQVNAHGCGFAQFVGMPGAGKTRLACNVIRELTDYDALYVRQGELTCALRASYGRKDVVLYRSARQYQDDEGDETPTPLELVQRARFLVLDEIGCTAFANDERLLVDELIKYRYEQRKPTILISNLPPTGTSDRPGLREMLGDALIDRIREATGNGKFILRFSGESFRRTTGERYLNGLPEVG